MKANVKHIPYSETFRFSKLVTDYLEKSDKLSPYFVHTPDEKGIADAISNKNFSSASRQLLCTVLQSQYKNATTHDKVKDNIQLLQNHNTFTVCTAHQPNLFTGPLYVVYKLLHVIRLCNHLHTIFPEKKFVPVYYMGSEDADLDELGSIYVDQQKYTWATGQTGAVGRMVVDDALLQMIADLEGRLSVEPFGNEVISLLHTCFVKGVTIQVATFNLINHLFGELGLVVFIPDNHLVKSAFIPILKKEITEQFSGTALKKTIAHFPADYSIQVKGRDVNLFYLEENSRERIELKDDAFILSQSHRSYTQQELLQLLYAHPDCFSPNVVLRPLLQEFILPNIAFIGGGGELAYWLELKGVFDSAGIPMPALILRNSFMLLSNKQTQLLSDYHLGIDAVFLPPHLLIKKAIENLSGLKLELTAQKESLVHLYHQINAIVSPIDFSLQKHIAALEHIALEKLVNVEKKMFRAQKKKHEALQRKLEKLLNELFPSDTLQERHHSFIGYYAAYGSSLLYLLYDVSLALEQQFSVLCFQD